MIIKLYNDGLSTRIISRNIGKSIYFINKALKEIVKRPQSCKKNIIYDKIKWENKDERNKLIIDLYVNKKFGAFKISKILDTHKGTIYKVLKSNGINTSNSDYSKSLDNKLIIDMYKNGKTLTEIADHFETTEGLISKRIPDNIERISRANRLSTLSDIDKKNIINLYNDKLSIYDISSKINKHPENIRRYLNKINIIRSDKERRELAKGKLINRTCFRSSLSRKVEDLLNELNISFTREFLLDGWLYDILIKDKNILIEINGEYWHKLKDRVQRDKVKRNVAIKHGYKLYYIWESFIKNKEFLINTIKYWLRLHNIIAYNFNDLIIKIDVDKIGIDLIKRFHYLGKIGNNGLTITGFINNNSIITAVFSPPTRQEIAINRGYKFDEVLELSRMSCDPNYQKKNLISYFLSKSIKIIKNNNNNIKMLISFADHSFSHDGWCYKASGWIYDGETEPNYWYQSETRNIMHKKRVWDNAKNVGLSEEQFANKNKLIKVYGLPKSRFIKILC